MINDYDEVLSDGRRRSKEVLFSGALIDAVPETENIYVCSLFLGLLSNKRETVVCWPFWCSCPGDSAYLYFLALK